MSNADLLIDPAELSALLGSPGLRLFDATVLFAPGERTARDQYLEEHIPGAAFLDHSALSDPDAPYMYMVPDVARLSAAIGQFGIDSGNTVVVYSTETLMWATRAFWVLRYAGLDDIRILNGGLAAWKDQAGEIESGESEYAPSSFSATPRSEMIASKEDVMTSIGQGGVCTINALPAAFYEGTDAVDYAAKGHITGSTNNTVHGHRPERALPRRGTTQNGARSRWLPRR